MAIPTPTGSYYGSYPYGYGYASSYGYPSSYNSYNAYYGNNGYGTALALADGTASPARNPGSWTCHGQCHG